MINLIGISGQKYAGKNYAATILQYLAIVRNVARSNSKMLTSENIALKIVHNWTDRDRKLYSGWETKAFADKLREVASLITGIPVADFTAEKYKELPMPEIWRRFVIISDNGHEVKTFLFTTEAEAARFILEAKIGHPYFVKGWQLPTYRQFLQWIGTDCFRDMIHPNTWVNALFSDYVPIGEEKNGKWLIPHTGKAIYQPDPAFPHLPYYTTQWNQLHDDPVFPNWIVTDVRFPNEVEAIERRGGIVVRLIRPDLSSTDRHQSETALDNYPFRFILTNRMDDSFVDEVRAFANEIKYLD